MVVRAAQSSAKTAAVMTAGSVARPLVRRGMPILTHRPRAVKAAISKTVMITAITAPRASFTREKKTRVRGMTSVRLMAAWTTAITVTAEV